MVRRTRGHGPATAVVLGAALAAATIAHPVSRAQPAAAELDQARALYEAAELAVRDGRFDDAARDYGASYELSHDAALLFKIGRANERAGRCDVALGYYARYLRDGKPAPQFAATTRERIAACGGDPAQLAPTSEGSAAAGSASSGSAAAGSASAGSGSGSASPAAPAAGPGSAAGSAAAPLTLVPSNRHKVAWVMTGSAIALVTLGGILAYAANSAENDVRDLYAGFNGRPPTFDAATRKTYDELIDQGHRYTHLSWASFGLAGAAAVGAAYLFATGRRDPSEPPRVTPVVGPGGAGVAVRF